MLTVDINCAVDTETPAVDELQRWAIAAYQTQETAEVALSIVDAKQMTSLNHQFRAKNSATNVLSFPSDAQALDGVLHLGDIILCADVIQNEAAQQHKPVTAHWAHMVVHGMLHLQAYDHANNSDAEKMESLEIDIMQALGFPNPYLPVHTAAEAKQ